MNEGTRAPAVSRERERIPSSGFPQVQEGFHVAPRTLRSAYDNSDTSQWQLDDMGATSPQETPDEDEEDDDDQMEF